MNHQSHTHSPSSIKMHLFICLGLLWVFFAAQFQLQHVSCSHGSRRGLSSPTRDGAHVLCTGRQILNLWTREAPSLCTSKLTHFRLAVCDNQVTATSRLARTVRSPKELSVPSSPISSSVHHWNLHMPPGTGSACLYLSQMEKFNF